MEPATTDGFVAINYIQCSLDYAARFEDLFRTRAQAIDRLPGFRHMYVLKPTAGNDNYLVVSHLVASNILKSGRVPRLS